MKNFENIIIQIAIKNNITPDEVMKEYEKIINFAWFKGRLKQLGIFTQKPTIEEFIIFYAKQIFEDLENIKDY